jgi:hypothetical protein
MFFWYAPSNVILASRRIEHVSSPRRQVQSNMMELALNLAWAILAAASYALLFRRFAIQRMWHARGASQIQSVIALTCVLAILFPVISLTDDLHEMQATAEEASPSGAVIKRCVAGLSSTPARTLHPVLFVFTKYPAYARRVIFGLVEEQPIRRAIPRLHLSAPGRAPPDSVVPQFV